ncbi:MAG: hypothetical protein ABIH90_01075 [Candidatus Aenigmatarchaeota archaeon]
MSIYRAYDVRGVYGETINEESMEKIGKALGTLMYRLGLAIKI